MTSADIISEYKLRIAELERERQEERYGFRYRVRAVFAAICARDEGRGDE